MYSLKKYIIHNLFSKFFCYTTEVTSILLFLPPALLLGLIMALTTYICDIMGLRINLFFGELIFLNNTISQDFKSGRWFTEVLDYFEHVLFKNLWGLLMTICIFRLFYYLTKYTQFKATITLCSILFFIWHAGLCF